MRIEVTETAEQDILATLDFYKAPSAQSAEFNDLVDGTTNYLSRWPYTGHRRRDLSEKDVCFWVEGNYMFVLAIRAETLTVVAVLHTSRNIAKILRKRLKRLR